MTIVPRRNLGMLVLAVWLIFTGITGLFPLGLPPAVSAGLAIIAGFLIVMGR